VALLVERSDRGAWTRILSLWNCNIGVAFLVHIGIAHAAKHALANISRSRTTRARWHTGARRVRDPVFAQRLRRAGP